MSSSTIASQNYSIAAFSLEVRSLVFYFIITHLIILLIAGNGKMDNHFFEGTLSHNIFHQILSRRSTHCFRQGTGIGEKQSSLNLRVPNSDELRNHIL